jgi:hypothetical protein
MSDSPQPPTIPIDLRKREVARRHIPGTNNIEVIFAIRDPHPPYAERFQRIVIKAKEEG